MDEKHVDASKRWLFLDMNAFFASCEQQERPALRGRPVAVAPVDAESTACIAASYEAKACGVRTGTSVALARRLCPGIVIVHARHEVYHEYHRQIMRLLRSYLPEVRKLSVDEMASPLLGGVDRGAGESIRLAQAIKCDLTERIGVAMRSSVGIAPNAFLAKVGSKMHKPNGLVLLSRDALPGPMTKLALDDLPGIGSRMLTRLYRCGIHTIDDLYAAPSWLLRTAWGGVVGERWWLMLRGDWRSDYAALAQPQTQTIGHTHVLPPEMRDPVGAEGCLLRLTARAVRRMRLQGLHARAIEIMVKHADPRDPGDSGRWCAASLHRTPAADPFTFVAAARELWDGRPPDLHRRVPTQVGVTFFDLVPRDGVTLPLFDGERRREAAAAAMDAICARFGKYAIEPASVALQREGTREAIAFGKITDDKRDEQPISAYERSKGLDEWVESGRGLLRV